MKKRPSRLHFKKNAKKHLIERTSNCGACGVEHQLSDLSYLKVADWDLQVCKNCNNRNPLEDFSEVVAILAEPEDNFRKALGLLREEDN